LGHAGGPAAGHRATGFYFDTVAAHLVKRDPDRAFALLVAIGGKNAHGEWDPLSDHGAHLFWSRLREHDRERAYRTAIEALGKNRYGIVPWRWREKIPLKEDGDVLVKLAAESEEQAVVVAGLLSIAQPEFWRIAFRLIEAYPSNDDLQDELGRQMRREGMMATSSLGERSLEWANEVERKMNDPSTPIAVQLWLREVHSRLISYAKAMLEREEVEDLHLRRSIPDDPHGPERLTAIKTLLETGQGDVVIQTIGRAELLDMLPSLGLSADRERAIRRELGSGDD
jgi:hypothetical protein